MTTNESTTTTDGPAQAMSVLYEANDLLNAMRTVSEEMARPMGSAEWTLSGEVSTRLNRAIELLDAGTPHPADVEPGHDEAKTHRLRMISEAQHIGYGVEQLCLMALNASGNGTEIDGDFIFPLIRKQVVEMTHILGDIELAVYSQERSAEAAGGAA